MNVVKTMRLRTGASGDLITLEGPGADWASGRTSWTGFNRVILHLAGGARLIFDASPAPPIQQPPSLPKAPTLEVASSSDILSGGSADTRKLRYNKELTLTFHWANPVTPAGAGVWIQLVLRAVTDEFALQNTSLIWRAGDRRRDRPQWSSRTFVPGQWTADQFAGAAIDYVGALSGADELGALIWGGAPDSAWLADLRDKDFFTYLHFELGPFDRVAGGDQPLVATMRVKAGNTNRAPVSSRALGGIGDPLGRSVLASPDLRLACVRVRPQPPGDPFADPRWIVDWRNVPADGPSEARDELCLPTAWRHLAAHYPLGLAAARSRSRFTAMPTQLVGEPNAVVTLRFEVAGDAYGDARDTQLRQISVGDYSLLHVAMGGAASVDGASSDLTFAVSDWINHKAEDGRTSPAPEGFRRIAVAGNKDYPFPDEALSVKRIAVRPADQPKEHLGPVDWLLGGVRARAAALSEAQLRLSLEGGGELLGQKPAGPDITLDFTDGELSPASQDPETGFETLAAWLPRPRPISLDLIENRNTADLLLRVVETASAKQSRLVRISLRRPANTTLMEYASDVVVIDSAPLTIARVKDQLSLDQEVDALIAEYTDDSEAPAGWEFRAGEGKMTIVLPPQVVGEEMVKGRLALPNTNPPEEVPVSGEPFQYRLSPNATLVADRTDVDTARTPPPWMLRRLLSRRLGVTGLKLDTAEFELVYGLTTALSAKGLRLGELDALVGGVPLADELVRLVKEARSDTVGPSALGYGPKVAEHQRAYASTRADWILDLLRRPSWWPLFRDVGARGVLSISDGVQVSLRDARETADPFRIADFAASGGAARAQLPPLRGGVDWLFQSPAIYSEFLKSGPSAQAMVQGLAFGPLGAEGAQSAAFANGKTVIISSTRQGHNDSLVLIRVGRIAQYWNHARHVIVYQRTSRRAPRYALGGANYPGYDTYDEQRPGLEGFMGLRKVREYVEITQPRRSLRDTQGGLPLAGPLGQCTFETTVIPVKASWARDIDQGQVIPLRGPLTPDDENIFPWPKIFVEAARAAEKGGGLVANAARKPEQFLFFTSTRPQDNGDPDTWPAWPDIDGPIWQPKVPEAVAFRPSFRASRRQPDARRAAIGQSRFTYDLTPNEEAIDLMAGRQANAIEARLHNVSIARPLPPVRPAEDSLANRLGDPLAEVDAYVSDKLSELIDYAREHAEQVQDTHSTAHQQFLKDAQQLISDLTPPVAKLTGLINQNKKALSDHTGSWRERHDDALAAFKANALAEFAVVAGQLDEAAKTVGAAANLADAKRRATAALQTAMLQLGERLANVGFPPDAAVTSLRRSVNELEADLRGRLLDAVDGLSKVISDVEAAYAVNPPRANDLESQWRAAALGLLEQLRKTSGQWGDPVAQRLGGLFAAVGGAQSAQGRLVGAGQAVIDNLAELLELAIDEVPPFEMSAPDFGLLRQMARDVAPGETWLRDELRSWLQGLETKLAGVKWTEPVDTALATVKAAADALEAEIQKSTTATQAAVAALLTAAAKQARDWAKSKALLDTLCAGLSAKLVDADWSEYAGVFDAAQDFARRATQLTTDLKDALRAQGVDAVLAALEDAVGEMRRTFGGAVKHAEHAIIDELRKANAELLDEAAATELELTRLLAGGINTDTLQCTREALGYYYERGRQLLEVTRSSAFLNDLGAATLNAISAAVPFDRIRDRLLPQLENLDFSDLFPDLCGLKLEYLFPELKVAKDKLEEYDWLRIKHGFDRDRLSAWSDVTVDKPFEAETLLFSMSPVTVSVFRARLHSRMRVELDEHGVRRQEVSASIKADWRVNLSGTALVTISEGELVFGNDGRFDFRFESENIVLSEEFRFITEAMKSLLPQDEGLTITPVLPAGVSATLALPLPDIGTGAFTLTGITLYCNFALLIGNGFEIRAGFWLSRPDRPFGLAILFLGGGGWLGVDVTYRPPGDYLTRASMGIAAGAFVALNLGFARGSAGLLFMAGVDYYRDSRTGSGSTAISLGLLIWGEFSILCIASAYLRLTAAITYTDDNGMRAQGRVEVSIRISFFFTLSVSRTYARQFSGGGGHSLRLAQAPALRVVATSEAIDRHYQTLDLPV